MRLFGGSKPTVETFMRDPRAARVHEALTNRDWHTAREILHTAPTLEHFAFYVMKAADVGGLTDWIDGPIREEPGSTLPLLIKGVRGVKWAWEARGTGGSNTVSEAEWKTWFRRLKDAEDCLDEVVDREPHNIEAWHWLITLARARQLDSAERWRRYHALAVIDPLHYYGNSQMLEALKAKWSGSADAMFGFARERAVAAPGTMLPTLIAEAHYEHAFDNGGPKYLERSEVADEIEAAAHQSIFHPGFRRTILTPVAWNLFAATLSRAGRHESAGRCFDAIGDEYILERTWSARDYVYFRKRTRRRLATLSIHGSMIK